MTKARQGRARGAALASALLVFQLVVASAIPQVVLGACATGRTHDSSARYVITAGDVSGINGISSSILEYDPNYTGVNSTGTNASVMLVGTSGGTRWAQLGWLKSKLDGGVTRREVFVEFYLSSSQNYFQFWTAKSLGSSTWYEILYGSPSTWNFFVAGTHYKTFTGTFTPSQYQVFGETHDYADQMPGGTSNHVTFTNTQYFTGSGTTHWVTSSIQAVSPYGGSHPSTGRYDIWDTKCAS